MTGVAADDLARASDFCRPDELAGLENGASISGGEPAPGALWRYRDDGPRHCHGDRSHADLDQPVGKLAIPHLPLDVVEQLVGQHTPLDDRHGRLLSVAQHAIFVAHHRSIR
jgi:hypothetical protein